MRHCYVKDDRSGDHWAVGGNSEDPIVLVQLQEGGEQVRLSLSPEHAEAMAEKLIECAARARAIAQADAAAHSIFANR